MELIGWFFVVLGATLIVLIWAPLVARAVRWLLGGTR